ncbi:hypothetical protein FRX31_021598, partial [Thalictrum thalictroides]
VGFNLLNRKESRSQFNPKTEVKVDFDPFNQKTEVKVDLFKVQTSISSVGRNQLKKKTTTKKILYSEFTEVFRFDLLLNCVSLVLFV